MGSVLDKYAAPSQGSVLDKYNAPPSASGSVLDKYASPPLAPSADPGAGLEIVKNSSPVAPIISAVTKMPGAIMQGAVDTMNAPQKLASGALGLLGGADFVGSLGDPAAAGLALQMPGQSSDERIAHSMDIAQQARDSYGTSVMRDAAMTGLMFAPGSVGFASNVGIPALMEASRAGEGAKAIGETLQPLMGDPAAPSGPINAMLQTAVSPEMMQGYLQAGLMAPGVLAKRWGQNETSLPEGNLNNAGLGPYKPRQSVLDKWADAPLQGLPGMSKLGDYVADSPGQSLASALTESLAKIPKIKSLIDYATPEKALMERQLTRDLGATPEDAAAARKAVHETPEEIYNQGVEEARQAETLLEQLSPVERRVMGNMLKSLPKQTLAENQKRQQDLLSNNDYKSRYEDYYNQAKETADGLYSTEKAINDGGVDQAKLNDTYAHLSALQRMAEDIGGQDQKSWFNYKKTAAEMADTNRESQALQQDPANYLNQASQVRASGQERLIRDTQQLRDVRRRLAAANAPGQAERFSKYTELLQRLEQDTAGLAKPAVSEGPVQENPLVGVKGAELRRTLMDQRVTDKALREAQIAQLKGKLSPGQEVPEIVRPSMAERAVFKESRQPRKPTDIVDADGKLVVSGATQALEQDPGARTRTIYESKEGIGNRAPVLPDQPVEAAPGPKILTPEEFRANKLKAQQLPALEKKRTDIKAIVDAAGLDGPQRKMLIHIDAVQRKIDANRPLDTQEHKALVDLEKTLSTRLVDKAKVESQYLDVVKEQQRNYNLGGFGYKKNVYASTLAKKYPTEAGAKASRLSGGPIGGRQALRQKTEGFQNREGIPGEQPLQDPLFGVAESIMQNRRLRAFSEMEQGLKATPFLKLADSPAQAKAFEDAGWSHVPADGKAHGGLADHWMAPPVAEVYFKVQSLRDPHVLAKELAHINGWMAGNKAVRNWSSAMANGLGLGFQSFADIGIPMEHIPSLFKASNLKNHPIYGKDGQRLGLSSIIQESPKRDARYMAPELTSAGFDPTKETGPDGYQVRKQDAPKPPPSLAEIQGKREAVNARERPFLANITDAIDAITAAQSEAVRQASGSDVAGAYMSPEKMGEIFRNMETNVRENAYLYLRERGVSHDAAAKRIKDAYVDYNDKSKLTKDMETYVVGGVGNRFAHFMMATSGRYAHLLTNSNLPTAIRAAAFPVMIGLLNNAQDDDRAKRAVLKERYKKEDVNNPAIRARLNEKAGQEWPGYAKALADKKAEQKDLFARTEAPYLAGANQLLMLDLGDDEKGRPVRVSFNRTFPYSKPFDIAAGIKNATDSTAPDRGRNAALALVGPGMAISPLVAMAANMDPFTRQSILETNDDGTLALPMSDPRQQRLLWEYALSQYMPAQGPGGQRFATAARLDRRQGEPSASIRGARGLLQTPASTMFSDLSGLKMNTLDPTARQKELADTLESQNRTINSNKIILSDRGTQSENLKAEKRAGEFYKKKADTYFPRKK